MNPYEADPSKIPQSDPYRDEPFYGRYHPLPNDFKPDPQHIDPSSAQYTEYWTSVLQRCNAKNRLYESDEDGRDVFAVGSVIIKSSHLKVSPSGRKAQRDYSFADANEIKAVEVATRAMAQSGVRVPRIYFADKIDGRNVLVQERIPGVGLNVAWPYLNPDQKMSFKQQAQDVLRLLSRMKAPEPQHPRSYIVVDPDPISHRGIQSLERDIIFSDANSDPDTSFAHNDFSMSNTIVHDDKIVGLVDWEMAGWHGVKTAREVHLQIRTPKRENFAQLVARGALSEDRLQDILFWNDLYDPVMETP